MDGPDGEKPKEENKDRIWTFMDVLVTKQFFEKGFRENFFTSQEKPQVENVYKKACNIVKFVMSQKT